MAVASSLARSAHLVRAALVALVATALLGALTVAVAPVARATDVTPGRALWAVDSSAAINSTDLAKVQSFYRGGTPSVWGRYLPQLSSTELSFAQAHRIGVMVIVHDANLTTSCGSDRTSAQATTDAKNALSNANALGLPAGTTLFKDFEVCANEPTSSYLQTWYDTVAATSYRVGFYGNSASQSNGFPTAYCAVKANRSAFAASVQLYASEPEPAYAPASGAQGPGNAPAYAPDKPSCAPSSATVVWQYGEVGSNTANIADIDEVLPSIRGLVGYGGSDPSATLAANGQPTVAFQAQGTNKLWDWNGALDTAGGGTPTNDGMAPGSSASVARLANGNLVAAFRADTGKLWIWTGAPGTTGVGTATNDGIADGTSPSLTVLPNGNLAVAFHAADTDKLWVWTGAVGQSGVGTATNDGLAPGTSPSIAAVSSTQVVVAFHASSTDKLWTWRGTLGTAGSGTATNDGMADGTSPSLALLADGSLAVAFNAADTDKLWVWHGAAGTTGAGTATNDGMAPGSDPSLRVLPGGNLAVGFQAADTGKLWVWTGATGQPGVGTSTNDGMWPGSSPSLLVLDATHVAAAFKADTGDLWTWHGALGDVGAGTATKDGVA